MNLIMFDYAVMHLLRICRILKIYNGNGMNFGLGGTGRSSLTKLSWFICDFEWW